MNEEPTPSEVSEVFNALMCVSAHCGAIYGVPYQIIHKVVKFWSKLGLKELQEIEFAKYQPKMKAPKFPIYDKNGDRINN